MRTVALLPMNALAVAKSRLASALDAEDRRALVLWMAERVLRAIQSSSAVAWVAVVSPDPLLLAWARDRHAVALHQTEGDLNAGLELGRRWSREVEADALLALFGDLPLLNTNEVTAFVASVEESGAISSLALASDRDGRGTNGLVMKPANTLPFMFGPDSFSRFTEAAHLAGVETHHVRFPGTSFDVDTPAHLDELLALGLWTPHACDTHVSVLGGNR